MKSKNMTNKKLGKVRYFSIVKAFGENVTFSRTLSCPYLISWEHINNHTSSMHVAHTQEILQICDFKMSL